MNWFERYGIPGAYFVGLTSIWIFAMCPDLPLVAQAHNFDLQWIAAFAAIIFLPIGYVISVFGQTLYLNGKFFGWRGCHTKALKRTGGNISLSLSTNNEAINEAMALLRSTILPPFNIETQQYVRDWIARRMDVLAIDQSLFIATILAAVVGACMFLFGSRQNSGLALIVLGIVSVIVLLITSWSICTLRRQVIIVIKDIFRKYGWEKP